MKTPTSIDTAEQLELFDIVPDRPLPSPLPPSGNCCECMGDGDDTLAAWLRRQSEDQLRAILDSLTRTNWVSHR